MEFERCVRVVRDILETVPVMTLATCADAAPWATDVYFAPQGWRLVFFSSPRSRHCRNLARATACAATIHPPCANWREIRGLQLEGTAGPVTGLAAQAAATAAYLAKFPFVRELFAAPGDLAGKLGRVSPHVFLPSRILSTDNASGFGQRVVLRLEDGQPVGCAAEGEGGD